MAPYQRGNYYKKTYLNGVHCVSEFSRTSILPACRQKGPALVQVVGKPVCRQAGAALKFVKGYSISLL